MFEGYIDETSAFKHSNPQTFKLFCYFRPDEPLEKYHQKSHLTVWLHRYACHRRHSLIQ